MKIRKAIIPIAGLGTRFLPAVKAQPKAMLTIVDKPIVQYIVEEVVASGIEEIIFVTDQMKRAVEDHFDRNAELEQRLVSKGKTKELEMMHHINNMAKFAFVRQQVPLGDGHAILSALPFIDEDEAVLVLYGDDIIDSEVPAAAQLMEVHEQTGGAVAALLNVPREETEKYGVASGKMISEKVMEISGYVEKPKAEEAPSTLVGVGRYLVTPDILKILKTIEPAKDGEIRLADAFQAYCAQGNKMYGRVVDGERYDCGNKLGFMAAGIHYGLKHQEVNKNGEFEKLLRGFCDKTAKNA
ncbi:MAG: UTP--glucose-1-phosphate uridylyltransferase [Patescibacteria group bacterium]|nr:UTP--glucose-1-phosphate uridylyltransferase [Patescibacteria group bacterium]